MGNWNLPFSFYLKFFLVFPITLVIMIPYWLLSKWSGQAADKYGELIGGPIEKLNDFVWGN